MGPLAETLAPHFRVIAPLQRHSSSVRLTVARHVVDLEEVLSEHSPSAPVDLVGHSWGAMLALAFAAAHPRRVRSLALIGCGTFDIASRTALETTRRSRMDEEMRRQLGSLPSRFADPDARLWAAGELLLPAYSHDLLTTRLDLEWCDARGYEETWNDMLSLQASGTYPAAFSTIDAPVLMLHGADDPHPGRLIETCLRQHIPRLEYHELEWCGHYPWLERRAREPFLTALRDWLGRAAR